MQRFADAPNIEPFRPQFQPMVMIRQYDDATATGVWGNTFET